MRCKVVASVTVAPADVGKAMVPDLQEALELRDYLCSPKVSWDADKARVIASVEEDDSDGLDFLRGFIYEQIFAATSGVIGDFDSFRVEIMGIEPIEWIQRSLPLANMEIPRYFPEPGAMTDTEWLLHELRSTLQRLAAPPAWQIEYLRSLGKVSNDELALEFDTVAPVAPALQKRGLLQSRELSAIEAVEKQLLSMSGEENAHLWTDEGLETAGEWDTVRTLAGRALALLQDVWRRTSMYSCSLSSNTATWSQLR